MKCPTHVSLWDLEVHQNQCQMELVFFLFPDPPFPMNIGKGGFDDNTLCSIICSRLDKAFKGHCFTMYSLLAVQHKIRPFLYSMRCTTMHCTTKHRCSDIHPHIGIISNYLLAMPQCRDLNGALGSMLSTAYKIFESLPIT